jgi:hypothetical protein
MSLLGAIASAGLAGCTISIMGQPPLQPAPPPEQAAPAVAETPAQDLQKLVAPIALYPDPLLAEVLAASTFPDKVQEAQQFVQANPTPSQPDIDSHDWPPSIKAMVHYPTALAMMANDMEWTQSLGAAFSNEQSDVMAAIQDLRVQAVNDGNLRSTPQQTVIVEGDPVVYIEPADPNVVFVPTYDPVVVYEQPTVIEFGSPYVTGIWFGHAFDWYGHGYYEVDDWRAGWGYGPDGWRRDRGYHWDRYHSWRHDDRWGRAPYDRRGHYAYRHDMRGREFHAARAEHLEAERARPERVQQRQIAQHQAAQHQAAQHAAVAHPAAKPAAAPPKKKPGT